MHELPWMTDDELRLATSRTLPGDAALNGDAAAAREAFLSLGGAIESASGDFDEAALVRRLRATLLSAREPALAAMASSTEHTSQRRWWPLVVGAALAASLAGVLFIPASTDDNSQAIAVSLEPQTSIDATSEPKQPIDLAVTPDTAAGDASLVAETWSDPLDDEISRAAATIGQLAGRDSGLDDSLLEINDRLEALVQELKSETL
jgi:hypothetical protein